MCFNWYLFSCALGLCFVIFSATEVWNVLQLWMWHCLSEENDTFQPCHCMVNWFVDSYATFHLTHQNVPTQLQICWAYIKSWCIADDFCEYKFESKIFFLKWCVWVFCWVFFFLFLGGFFCPPDTDFAKWQHDAIWVLIFLFDS